MKSAHTDDTNLPTRERKPGPAKKKQEPAGGQSRAPTGKPNAPSPSAHRPATPARMSSPLEKYLDGIESARIL
ncbi:MAG: hypothetical protein ABI318_09065, partial [Chthoniobacteraceae bacterium]